MRRARPTSWLASPSTFLVRPSSSDGEQQAGDDDASSSPRTALGSDQVLPDNAVTLLMSRRQRGEEGESDDEGKEEGEEGEWEDVVLDVEGGPAGPESHAPAGAAAAAATSRTHGGGHPRGATGSPRRRSDSSSGGSSSSDSSDGRSGSSSGAATTDDDDPPTATIRAERGGQGGTGTAAALALLLSAFLVRQRREREQRHQQEEEDEEQGGGTAAAAAARNGGSLAVTDRLRTRMHSCWAPVARAMGQNHLVVLYCFGAFVMVRMVFFAFSRGDSKLISFCAFVLLLGAYIWWSRRVRVARMQAAQEAAAAAARQLTARRGGLFEGMDLRELQSIVLEARLHEDRHRERGLSAEGKAALIHFAYCPAAAAASPTQATQAAGDSGSGGNWEEGKEEEEGGPADVPAMAMAVRRSSSSSLSVSSSKQPSGVWTGGEGEEGASEAAGVKGSSNGDCVFDDEEEEEEGVVGGMGKKDDSGSGASAQSHPPGALLDRHCSICLFDYEEGDSVCMLPACHHCFHSACLDMWLSSHTRCPLCQFDLQTLASSSFAGGAAADAATAATPMAPRRRRRERDSDGEEENEEEEEEPQSRRGRVFMTLARDRPDVMRIVAVEEGRG